MYCSDNKLLDISTHAIVATLISASNLQLDNVINLINRNEIHNTCEDNHFEQFSDLYRKKYNKNYQPLNQAPISKNSKQVQNDAYFSPRSYYEMSQLRKNKIKSKPVSLKQQIPQTAQTQQNKLYESVQLQNISQQETTYSPQKSRQYSKIKERESSKFGQIESTQINSKKPLEQSVKETDNKVDLIQSQIMQLSGKIRQQQARIDNQLEIPKAQIMQFSFCIPKPQAKVKTRPSIGYRKQRSYSMKEIKSVHNLLVETIQDLDNLKRHMRQSIRTLSAGQLTVIEPKPEPKRIKINLNRFLKK